MMGGYHFSENAISFQLNLRISKKQWLEHEGFILLLFQILVILFIQNICIIKQSTIYKVPTVLKIWRFRFNDIQAYKWFFVHIQRTCYSFGSRLLEVKSKSEEEWIDLHILLLGEIEFILTLYIQFVYAVRHMNFMRISTKGNIHVNFIYRSTCKCKKKIDLYFSTARDNLKAI